MIKESGYSKALSLFQDKKINNMLDIARMLPKLDFLKINHIYYQLEGMIEPLFYGLFLEDKKMMKSNQKLIYK
jgi:hypothetical protein